MCRTLADAEVQRASKALLAYAGTRGWHPMDPLLMQLWTMFRAPGGDGRMQMLLWLERETEPTTHTEYITWCATCKGNGMVVTAFQQGEEVLSTCSTCHGSGTKA